MRKRIKTEDMELTVETNFNLNEWVGSLSGKLTKNVLKKSKIYMDKIIKKRFRDQMGPNRKRWKPLSPLTLAYRKRKGKGKRPLVRTGRMMKSIKTTITKGVLRVYTSLRYARIQQKGATIDTTPKQQIWMWANLFNKKGNPWLVTKIRIPPRPFLWFSKKDAVELKRIIVKEVKKSERIGK